MTPGLPIQMHLIAERIMMDSNYICGQGNVWTDSSIQYNLSTIIVPDANLYSTHPHGCCRQATGSTSTYKNIQERVKNCIEIRDFKTL